MSDTSLMRLSKAQLIERLRCAEHNQDVANERLERAYQNTKNWAPIVTGSWVTFGLKNAVFCSHCRKVAHWSLAKYCEHCGSKQINRITEDESAKIDPGFMKQFRVQFTESFEDSTYYVRSENTYYVVGGDATFVYINDGMDHDWGITRESFNKYLKRD